MTEAVEDADTSTDTVSYATRFIDDYGVHVGVVAFFAIYPLLYGTLVNTPFGDEFAVVLPRVRTMVAVFYVGLFAMSFDFISGYTGYLSFGHALFYGTGAYLVVAVATGRVPLFGPETPFMLSLVLAGLLAVVLAVVVGAVSFRLTGVYFAMITLGFAEVAHVFVRNWNYISNNPRDGVAVGSAVDGFAIGVPGIEALQFQIGRLTGDSVSNLLGLGIDLSSTDISYYAIGVVVLVCYAVMQRILHSPFGRVMIAIRENEDRARAIGYDVFWYKLGAFAFSGFFAAVAGGLFAGFKRSVAPENTFDLFVTADALIAAIIGGFGTLAGPLYGYLFHEVLGGVLSTEHHGLARYLRTTLPDSLLSAGVGDVAIVDVVNVLIDGRADLYLGIVFILFVLYVPHGILGTVRDKLGGPVADSLPEHVRRYLR